MRASPSVPPPGGNGTTNRSGFSGYRSCAPASEGAKASESARMNSVDTRSMSLLPIFSSSSFDHNSAVPATLPLAQAKHVS
jgi:hypothetical protein